MARGMVIIGGDEYGESMELVKCMKKAACKLAETLSEAHMDNRHYEEDEDDDDEDFDPKEYMEMMHRRGGSRGGGRMSRRMPRSGRYGY